MSDLYQEQSRLQKARLLEELEWRRCRKSWRYWLRNYVNTKDEADDDHPFKPFFSDVTQPDLRAKREKELPYVFLLGQLYLHVKQLIILKSRQLRCTWLFCALDLWQAGFFPARFFPITAFKEDDAKDILDRIEFIYHGLGSDHCATQMNPDDLNDRYSRGLPAWMQARMPVAIRRGKPIEMEFLHNGSLIRACPDGSEQLRGKTISRWRNEESRSQVRLGESYQAVLPAVKNGSSKACFVSSAGPGFFQKLVEDTLDAGKPPPKKPYPIKIPGIQIWRNARNGYLVVRIHYTADPAKATELWARRTKRGFADFQWAMEYEIDFTARGGQLALDCFIRNYHKIVIPPFTIDPSWTVFGSADYGFTSPYSYHSYAVGPRGELYVCEEYYSPGPLGMHLAVIKSLPLWVQLRVLLYILDRSCWASTQQVTGASASAPSVEAQTRHAVRSIAELHQDHGIYPTPATVTGDPVKIEALWKEWNVDEGELPTVYIFATCTNMIRELHGIRWAERKETTVHQNETLIDRDNHAFDELCYAVLHYRGGGKSEPVVRVLTRGEEQLAQIQHQVNEYLRRLDKAHEDGAESPSGNEETWGEYGSEYD